MTWSSTVIQQYTSVSGMIFRWVLCFYQIELIRVFSRCSITFSNRVVCTYWQRLSHNLIWILRCTSQSQTGKKYSSCITWNESKSRHHKINLAIPPFKFSTPICQSIDATKEGYFALWDMKALDEFNARNQKLFMEFSS